MPRWWKFKVKQTGNWNKKALKYEENFIIYSAELKITKITNE